MSKWLDLARSLASSANSANRASSPQFQSEQPPIGPIGTNGTGENTRKPPYSEAPRSGADGLKTRRKAPPTDRPVTGTGCALFGQLTELERRQWWRFVDQVYAVTEDRHQAEVMACRVWTKDPSRWPSWPRYKLAELERRGMSRAQAVEAVRVQDGSSIT